MSYPANTVLTGVPLLTAGTTTDQVTAAWTSATAQNTALVLNVVNWSTVSVSLNQGSTITGGSVIFEVSDTLAGTTWFPLSMVPTGGTAAVTTYNLVASTNIAFQMNVAGFALFRVRLSNAILGSATVNVGVVGDSTAAEFSTVIGGPVDANGNIKTTIVGSVDSSQVVNRYASTSASGTATAPTAGTAIATLAVFDFYYRVDVVVGFGGTAESTAINNMKLKAGANDVAVVPVVNVANSQSPVYTFYVNPGGSVNLTVVAISNAAPAGAVYKATITATRLV